MKKEEKQYNSLFKENAAKLCYERKNVSGFAWKFGVSAALIYRWREDYSQI